MNVFQKVLRGEGATREELKESTVPELNALSGCPQTACHHQEGDVAVHTEMVLEETEQLLSTGTYTPAEKSLLRIGALLHDVGKPSTTREKEVDGYITYPARGHDEEGAKMVNLLVDTHPELWELGVHAHAALHALVRNHMWPHHAEDLSAGAVLRSGELVRPGLLAALWSVDTRGRRCSDPAELAEKVEYAELVLQDAYQEVHQMVLDLPEGRVRREAYRALVSGRAASEGAMRAYIASRERKEEKGTLTYTVGLPGSGKSTWARREAEQSGAVVLSAEGSRRRDRRAARIKQLEELPVHLREGRDVIFDATSTRRQARDLLLGTAEQYGAKVRAVYFHVPLPVALKRQESREWRDSVPAESLVAMRRDSRFLTPDEYDQLTIVEAE